MGRDFFWLLETVALLHPNLIIMTTIRMGLCHSESQGPWLSLFAFRWEFESQLHPCQLCDFELVILQFSPLWNVTRNVNLNKVALGWNEVKCMYSMELQLHMGIRRPPPPPSVIILVRFWSFSYHHTIKSKFYNFVSILMLVHPIIPGFFNT